MAAVFDERRLPFLVIGGMAVSVWVRPRLTDDVDIVVMARRRDAPRLKPALVAVGAKVTALEMRLLFDKRFVRLKIDKVKLDVHIGTSALDFAAFRNAAVADFGGRNVRVATGEDLVLYKLIAWRLQDQADIVSIMQQVRDLRRTYIESWLDRLGREIGADLHERWESVKKAR